MHIDPNDWMDRAYYLGVYEQHLARLIKSVVRAGDVCIDVGAQKGYATLHLANACGPQGRVIAFEPDRRAVAQLRANAEKNYFENILLYACSLSNEESVHDFAISKQIGWSSRFPNELARPHVESVVSVQSRRLDDVFEELGFDSEGQRVTFLKIDAEGSEPLVLLGAERTIKHFRPIIHIEINKSSLQAGGYRADTIEQILRSHSYRLYAIRLRKKRVREWIRPNIELVQICSIATEIGECEDVLAIPGLSGDITRLEVDEQTFAFMKDKQA
jgi:FkbM family methyltransferase